MIQEPLQTKCIEILSELDPVYDDAVWCDLTVQFRSYIEETVRKYGIVIICIRGYMRSMKSTAGFFIAHLIRYYQQKYINPNLPFLTSRVLIQKNQSHLLNEVQKCKFDQIYQCDEDIALTGVGSMAEELTINNVLEVTAKARNHIIFLNPSKFMFTDACKYGLLFYDRDDNQKVGRFMLYDMSNNYHKDDPIPLGLVTIPKLVDYEWKKANMHKKCIFNHKEVIVGEAFDSFFEFDYEFGIKDEIVQDQMKLESSKVRSQRLFAKVDEFKKDITFMTAVKNGKGMDVRRFIRGYVAKQLGGQYNSEEIQQLSDYVEGIRDSLFDT